jgi:hypothetical protein
MRRREGLLSTAFAALAVPGSGSSIQHVMGETLKYQDRLEAAEHLPDPPTMPLWDIFLGLDTLDLVKLVLLMNVQKIVVENVAKAEKVGNRTVGEVWEMCVMAVSSRKLPKQAVIDAKRIMTNGANMESQNQLRYGCLTAIRSLQEEPERQIEAARALAKSDSTLMDEETREVIEAVVEEIERNMRKDGKLGASSPAQAFASAVNRKLLQRPTSTIRQPARLVMIEWGAHALALSNAGEADGLDRSAFELTRASLSDQELRDGSEESEKMAQAAEIAVFMGVAWAACGFPQIVPSHKLAAALMATDLPENVELHLPWNSFAVVVPDGLLPEDASSSRYKSVDMIGLAISGEAKIGVWIGHKNHGIIGVDTFPSLGEMLACKSYEPEQELLMRLLIGCILEMDSPRAREGVRTSAIARKKSREDKRPTAWSFELKRDVKVDCRSWVRDYVSSGGTSPSVRSLVRGHQKRQRYGPGGALRKWIHIEPYWKGPLDGPIAVRAHKIGAS